MNLKTSFPIWNRLPWKFPWNALAFVTSIVSATDLMIPTILEVIVDTLTDSLSFLTIAMFLSETTLDSIDSLTSLIMFCAVDLNV